MECVQSVDGRSLGKYPLGRPRRCWDYNIRTDLRENGCGTVRVDVTGSGSCITMLIVLKLWILLL